MLLFSLISSPIQFLIFIIAILISLTIHEFAHALIADRLGDPTPRLMGRLTLNPIAHLDLFGTIFLLIAGFGWGKPVIVNSRNFKNPTWDNLTVSLAGPMSNLLLAIVLGLIIRFVPVGALATNLLTIVIFYNLVFMIFNFLPIPPLDGSKVLALFIPENAYLVLQQFGIIILLGLLFFFRGGLSFIIERVVSFFFALVTGQVPVGL
ncbi:hypothetical protein A2V71_04170 [Candidatus Berkelbacteria bacterium RBG_13_40_8]|uniref:Peptidase M50 domain-containing protein n=1 Tax=Candidatus Berkelbacteria bacterium RBG_13_40_8 TaxID=1797467 RepID=A0A1F5DNW8_9BACT|nr:MAG: hypothetical protein A2V71_04170 [Candidatus Berkelbacteria bacterium RBG_13_40_8]